MTLWDISKIKTTSNFFKNHHENLLSVKVFSKNWFSFVYSVLNFKYDGTFTHLICLWSIKFNSSIEKKWQQGTKNKKFVLNFINWKIMVPKISFLISCQNCKKWSFCFLASLSKDLLKIVFILKYKKFIVKVVRSPQTHS